MGLKEIRECQSKLDSFWTKFIDREPGESLTPVVFDQIDQRDEFHTDDDIFQKAMNAINGDKFKQLWEGNWKEAGYTSQSEADLAFCGMLARHTNNPQKIDFFLRRSGLRRGKLERDDYRNRTIQKVLRSQQRQTDYKRYTAKELVETDLPEAKWAVPNILPEGLNILGGKPKMGESIFALNMALIITKGERDV